MIRTKNNFLTFGVANKNKEHSAGPAAEPSGRFPPPLSAGALWTQLLNRSVNRLISLAKMVGF
jgi:hypothetical protein